MFEHLETATADGQRIGLMHFPSFLHTVSIDSSFPRWIMDAFASGRLYRVEITDHVRAKLTHIYDPTAFQFARAHRSGHAADKVIVWAAEPPFNRVTNKHKYAVGTVERNLSMAFGAETHWMPLNGATYRALSNSGYGRNASADLLVGRNPPLRMN